MAAGEAVTISPRGSPALPVGNRAATTASTPSSATTTTSAASERHHRIASTAELGDAGHRARAAPPSEDPDGSVRGGMEYVAGRADPLRLANLAAVPSDCGARRAAPSGMIAPWTPLYAHGTSSVPLLGQTIGEVLRRTVAAFPEREALVVRSQRRRAIYQTPLSKIKVENLPTGKRDKQRFPKEKRNQLANCMLLSREENGAGCKSDTLPEVWFADKSPEYLAKHLIPTDPALWKVDRFDDFIEARKTLLLTALKPLLVASGRYDRPVMTDQMIRWTAQPDGRD
jgi:hypothetical protein